MQRHPDRAFVRGANLAASLPDPPAWFDAFVSQVAAAHSPARAAGIISSLGQLLTDRHSNRPQALLDRAASTGRSVGPLARALEGFFIAHRLALPADHAERRAAARRQRRVDSVPQPLRPAVAGFESTMVTSRDRARRAGTRPRTDHTIETALAVVAALSRFLHQHGRHDWAAVDVHDIEAFLALRPAARDRRVVVLRQFFRHARRNRLILIDPTAAINKTRPRSGFTGRTLTMAEQRVLFRRWTTDTSTHPHESLLGLLALLHAASSHEVRHLRRDHVDPAGRTVWLGRRPEPVPLDPVTWDVVERCLDYRDRQLTKNPHLVVTRVTKAGTEPASAAYFTHLLDPAEVAPRTVRCTRLAELVNTVDPKLVAAALGMDAQGAMFYLADHVDGTPLERTNP